MCTRCTLELHEFELNGCLHMHLMLDSVTKVGVTDWSALLSEQNKKLKGNMWRVGFVSRG